MRPRIAIVGILLLAAAVAGVGYTRHDHTPVHYTGFVEGEERVIRSEVSGRVLDVRFAEGASVPADAIVAVLDDRDMQARINTTQQELAVAAAETETQEERIRLVESTWPRDVSARQAELSEAEAAAKLAERNSTREDVLLQRGVSAAQQHDDARARRDQARSALDRAREMLARAQAEERNIALARHELAMLHDKHDLINAQLAELGVTQSKYRIHSPSVATVVQTQFIWPGELAQPGTAILSVIDPADKYVQIYVPVADVSRLQLGQHVDIELDSQPGHRVPGEISFVADKANFTPEKIETRNDRMGQVYRAKVRILQEVERFQPGTEGNVYLDGSSPLPVSARNTSR